MTKVTFEDIYKICEVLLSGTAINMATIKEDTIIYQAVGSNSIYLIMIALAIQEKYHVEIPQNLITSETRIKDIVDYINENDSA